MLLLWLSLDSHLTECSLAQELHFDRNCLLAGNLCSFGSRGDMRHQRTCLFVLLCSFLTSEKIVPVLQFNMWSLRDSGQPFPGQCVSLELSCEAEILSRTLLDSFSLSSLLLKKFYRTTHSIGPNKSTSMKRDKGSNSLGEGSTGCEI